MCRCSIFRCLSFSIEFCKRIAHFIVQFHTWIYPKHTTTIITWFLFCCWFFSLLFLLCAVCCCCECFFIIIWVSVPYFTFHTNRIHSVSIRHRTNFHRNKDNNTSSTHTHTSKRNITIHLTDIHQIWCTHTDTALTDTDTDTRERFHSVFFRCVLLLLLHLLLFNVLLPLSFLLHTPSAHYGFEKPSFLLRINVLMLRCLCFRLCLSFLAC